MKITIKKVLAALIPLLAGTNLHAQCWNTINTVTTAPGATGSVNTWDWTQQSTTMYLRKFWNYNTNTCPPTTVTLPMWAQSSSLLQNDNLISFQDLLDPTLKDHQPADGWELLFKNFGDPSTFDKTVENPIYALYNRYSGKIRLYYCLATTPSDLNKRGVSLVLSFADGTRKTGLLQHMEPIAQPVINFTASNTMNVPNFYSNEDMYWFFADFPVAYDPCTCHDIKESIIDVELQAITQYDLTATINGTVVSTPVVQNSSGTPQPGSSDKNSGLDNLFNQSVIDAGKKGYEYYNTWDGYRSKADKVFDQMDKYVQNQVNDQLKTKYPNGIDVNGTHYNPTVADFKKTTDGTKKLLGEDYDTGELSTLKSFASVVPWIAAVWGVVDFFVNNSSKTQKAQQAPVATNANVSLKLNGTSISTSRINYSAVHTPGSTTSTSYNAMPIYNNILGVVNVMSIPNFEYVEYKPRYSDGSGDPSLTNGFVGSVRQYRLKGDVRYVLNPAAKMDLISADASIVLEFADSVIFPKGGDPMTDVDQMPVEFGDPTDPSFNIDSVQVRMQKAGWETEYLSNGYFNYLQNPSSPILGIYRIRTPYTPLQCISQTVFNLFSHKNHENPALNTNLQCCRNRAPRIMLKVVFTLKRQDKTTDDGIFTQIVTYDLTAQKANETQNTSYGNLYYNVQKKPIGSGAYTTYASGFYSQPVWATFMNTPKELHLSNTTVASDLYVQDNVYLDGNVTINNGVTIHAGKKIEVNPAFASVANYTNSLVIGLNTCTASLSDAKETDANILAFCTSDPYHSKAVNTARMVKNTEDVVDPVINGDKNVELFPNPVSSDFSVICNNFNGENTLVTITDMAGRVLFHKSYTVEKNQLSATFNFNATTLGLTSGFYLMTVQNGTFKKTLKFSSVMQ